MYEKWIDTGDLPNSKLLTILIIIFKYIFLLCILGEKTYFRISHRKFRHRLRWKKLIQEEKWNSLLHKWETIFYISKRNLSKSLLKFYKIKCKNI